MGMVGRGDIHLGDCCRKVFRDAVDEFVGRAKTLVCDQKVDSFGEAMKISTVTRLAV